MLETIPQDTLKGKRDYAMLALMLTMGLRTIEVSRANVGDIRTQGDAVVLYVQGKGHVDKDALVRMPNHVETAVRTYLKARPSEPSICLKKPSERRSADDYEKY
ncbi:hypothetical protein OF390_05985 [Limosilactobacillus fermentum]|nr:hypothetical protein [Limosilactobacillus fermentum]MCV3755526.1 hypothetical protein [Limosilactobacillus fermentum]